MISRRRCSAASASLVADEGDCDLRLKVLIAAFVGQRNESVGTPLYGATTATLLNVTRAVGGENRASNTPADAAKA
jgi:hypothetical protein